MPNDQQRQARGKPPPAVLIGPATDCHVAGDDQPTDGGAERREHQLRRERIRHLAPHVAFSRPTGDHTISEPLVQQHVPPLPPTVGLLARWGFKRQAGHGRTIRALFHRACITMIYKFKSKAAGDVIMMGPAGDDVLRLIGKAPGAQGIINVASMPAAIAALEAAVAAEDAQRAQAEKDAAAEGRKLAPREAVSLRQRAWPLVEMMKRSAAEQADIVWGA